MKDIKTYILKRQDNSKISLLESTQDEDLQEEVGLALKKFGSVRHGFKVAKKQDIIDVMYNIGFDYDEENSNDSELSFVGDYVDDKYEVKLYVDKANGDNITLKNYNVFLT